MAVLSHSMVAIRYQPSDYCASFPAFSPQAGSQAQELATCGLQPLPLPPALLIE
jgi:hypothetical protein